MAHHSLQEFVACVGVRLRCADKIGKETFKGAMLMLSQWEAKNRNILKTDRDISLKFDMYLLHGYTKPTLDKLFDSVQYSR